jgi:hypothetical protein
MSSAQKTGSGNLARNWATEQETARSMRAGMRNLFLISQWVEGY